MRSRKRIRLYIMLAGFIFSLILLAAFALLRAEKSFIWPDKKDFDLNEKINQRNLDYAKHNPFGFTDKVRDTIKPKGIYRIAVIGDSFVWGDGLPYEQAWSHKLERKLLEGYDSVEVISWGHSGWSTLDEFNFFKQHGKDYNVDLLIIGWVDNDPDMGDIYQKNAGDPKQTWGILYKLAPTFVQSMVNNANGRYYHDWMVKIFGRDNLNNYQNLLADFRQCLALNRVTPVVVMTPGSAMDQPIKDHFNLVKPLFAKTGFPCLEIFDTAAKRLEKYDPMLIQANRANGHPGDLMTEEFTVEVMAFLEQNGYLKPLHKRGS